MSSAPGKLGDLRYRAPSFCLLRCACFPLAFSFLLTRMEFLLAKPQVPQQGVQPLFPVSWDCSVPSPGWLIPTPLAHASAFPLSWTSWVWISLWTFFCWITNPGPISQFWPVAFLHLALPPPCLWQGQHHGRETCTGLRGSSLGKALHLISWPAVTILGFPNHFISELGFFKQSLVGHWSLGGGEMQKKRRALLSST